MNTAAPNTRSLLRLATLCVLSTAALAEPDSENPPAAPPAESKSEAEPGLFEREQLAGDLWGHRTAAAEKGITFDPYLIVDFSKNVRGGRDTEGSAFRHLFSFNATVDFTKLLGWSTGSLYIDFQNQAGQPGSDEVGDFQFVANWDADGFTQISEVYFQCDLFEDRLRLLLGKVDANWHFATYEIGGLFVHGSTAYPATNLLIPTYPDPAFSANAFLKLSENVTISGGIYDGALAEGIRTGSRGPATLFGSPSDLFLIGEASYRHELGAARLPGRIAAGAWYHTGTFDRYAGGTQHGTAGFHLIVEQMLWLAEEPSEESPADLTSRGIGLILMYNCADEEVSPAVHHLNLGLTWRGALEARPDDEMGVVLAAVAFTREPEAGFRDEFELACEVMYRAQVTPACAVQPYVQYIVNPGGSGLDDAWNLGVRLSLQF
jgi:porin